MRRRWSIFLLALALLACRHPLDELDPDLCTLRVRVGTSGARTVVPDFDAIVDEVAVTLHSLDGYDDPAPQADTEAPWQVNFTVSPGRWTIDVAAMKGGVRIGGGQRDVDVAGGLAPPVEVPVTIPPVGTTGSVRFAVCVDPDTLGVDYVAGAVEGTAVERDANLAAADGKRRGVLEFESLDAGIGTLVLTFRRGGAAGTVAGIFREKVVVAAGYESADWVGPDGTLRAERTFTADDFLDSGASLAGFAFDNGLLDFSFAPGSAIYLLGRRVGLPATVGFTATVAPGQSLSYSWNGSDAAPIASGEKVNGLAVLADNTLLVQVTAPDRTTPRLYRVTFESAPADVSAVTASTSSTSVTLNWINPTEEDFAGAEVSYRVEGSATVLGTVMVPGTSGSAASYTVPGLTPLAPYVFTLRSYDGIPTYSSGVSSWACPGGPSPGDFSLSGGTITGYTGSSGNLVIPSSINGVPVTGIANSAFSYKSNIVSVRIPDSVVSIGQEAFYGCGLTSLTIPGSVRNIERFAFGSGGNLTSLTIGEGVESIGDFAFVNCAALTTVHLPASLKSVSQTAFTGCEKITSFTVAAGNADFRSVDGVLFNADLTTLVRYPEGKPDAAYAVPSGVRVIADYAFFTNHAILTSLTLPETVTTLGAYSLQGLSTLTALRLPESVATIGLGVCTGCSALKDLTVERASPPAFGGGGFYQHPAGFRILVPAAGVDAYKAAAGWSEWKDFIFAK